MVGIGILSNNMISPSPHCVGRPDAKTPFTLLLIPNSTFYLIARGFHRPFAMGVACQLKTSTPPDTWSCPTLGLACALVLTVISPELVLFSDLLVSNIPRYFCFIWYIRFTIDLRVQMLRIPCT